MKGHQAKLQNHVQKFELNYNNAKEEQKITRSNSESEKQSVNTAKRMKKKIQEQEQNDFMEYYDIKDDK